MAALTAERDRLKRFAEWCLSARYDGRNVGILARQALATPEPNSKEGE